MAENQEQPAGPIPPASPVRGNFTKRFGIGLAVVALPVAAAYTAWELKQGEDAHKDDLENRFKYDDAALRQVDPALIGWQEVGRLDTGMQKPTCIAFLAGKVYVGGEGLVRILDGKGRELASFSVPGAPTAISASSSGDVYVALKNHLRIYNSTGQELAAWGSVGEKGHVTSIAVGADRVYVADSGLKAGRVLAYTLEGKPAGELAKRDDKAGIPGIITPSSHMDLAIAADGNLWVANPGRHQLELYAPSGELIRAIGQAGTGIEQFLGCCNPSDFALLSDGRIVTAEKGVPRIKVYQSDGHLDKVVAAPSEFGGNRAGLDIAVDAGGNVLVLEPGTSVIRVFAEKKE